MKSIFQQLFSNKAEKESKKLTAWMLELDDMDDIAALRFSTQKLAQLMEDQQLSTQQQLDLIIEIETLNRPRLEKLASQFVNVANLKQDLEAAITETCYNYCRQSYISHLKTIEHVIDPEKFDLQGNMPAFILLRTINVALNMLKWRMFVQQTPPTKMWLQIFMLYKIALKRDLLGIPLEPFTLHPSTTLSAAFVQICMLGELQQANMQKDQIELTTKLLKTWITHADIITNYTPDKYLFYVDLEKDTPAKRIRNLEPNENCRYWELDDLEKQLAVAITVTGRGEMPQSLAFSRIDHVKKLNGTLQILYEEWKRQQYIRQRRKESREATSRNAKVNAGIADICSQVLQANQISNGLRIAKQGKTLDELLRGHTVLKQPSSININSGSLDTWIITDSSKSGLGARVNKYAKILARPDKLIGLVFDDELDKVIIGTIRSVKPTQGNQLKVGIEIISHKAIWLQLQQIQEDNSFLDTITEINKKHRGSPLDTGLFSGIYLPAEPGLSEESTLILPKLSYRPNVAYMLHVGGKPRRENLGMPIDSKDDWVKIAAPF